ncbi:hypothetical protein ABH13_1353 [Bacillus velezensis]|nr:hypothetical protein ABH13_1353 [Bacillus velezensis]
MRFLIKRRIRKMTAYSQHIFPLARLTKRLVLSAGYDAVPLVYPLTHTLL